MAHGGMNILHWKSTYLRINGEQILLVLKKSIYSNNIQSCRGRGIVADMGRVQGVVNIIKTHCKKFSNN